MRRCDSELDRSAASGQRPRPPRLPRPLARMSNGSDSVKGSQHAPLDVWTGRRRWRGVSQSTFALCCDEEHQSRRQRNGPRFKLS